MKRILSAFLAFAFLFALAPLPAYAAADLSASTVISGGLTLSASHVKLNTGSLRRAFTLDYTPGQTTAPLILYGDKLYGKSTIDEVVAYAEKLGYTVMAATNADYFHLETGLPTGMTIQNGRLCTSDGAWNAVGFCADGTAIVGAPGLQLTLTQPDGTDISIVGLNKTRTTAGLYLYSSDFSATTRTTRPGTEILLQLSEGETMAVGETVTATVVSGGTQTATPIGENQLVLSLASDNTSGLTLSGFGPGSQVAITAAANSGWEDVVWSTGGGNLLAKDGVLTAEAKSGDDARTVLGVYQDGSVSVYVCDGRQSTLSSGISTQDAAQFLLNKGCRTVICLDGGGSSAISARYPGQSDAALQNSPSDGTERACATYLLFVNTGDKTLEASRATVYPRAAAVLAGATVPLSALTSNADYFPTGTYDDLYSVVFGDGYVVDNLLYTPIFSDTLSVAADVTGLSSDISVFNVTDAPAELQLVPTGDSTALQSLALSPNEVYDIDVRATDGIRQLISQDTQFTFSLSPSLGTIDEQGVITAVGVSGLSGTLTASYNGVSVSIPVAVGRAPQVLEDFELGAQWSASAVDGVTAAAVLNTAVENSRYGHNSLHLSAVGEAQSLTFTAAKPLTLPSGAQTLSLLIKGSGRYLLNFATASGDATAAISADGDDWKYCAVSLPAGATALAGITAVGDTLNHDAYIDQLMVHFGAAANDVVPPTLTVQPFDGLVLNASIHDNYAFPVEKSMISVTLDGKTLDFSYDADTGVLVCDVPQSAGMHRITISARDYFLNYARTSLVFGETVSYSYADLAGHWCADYAEYLHLKGIYDNAESFNPGTNVTNAMAATLLSRYLGIDTSLYDNVVLPYADADEIPDWALPHVRAMYALSIMMGSYSYGQSVLRPNMACSRAQIMTILGRTMGRGFSYPQAQFSDFDTAPDWARDHISLLASVGVVDGYGGATGEVRPNGTITRAEFASLLFKMF